MNMEGTGWDRSGGLSGAARSVWAKHDRDAGGWLPLWRHMADSGAVAGLLWDEWLPGQVVRLVAESLPGGADDGRRLARWLAATHDIGKATPAFACQVEELADVMRAHGLDMPVQKRLANRRLAPHGMAGQVLLQQWLEERHGWARRATAQFAIVAGGHHGVPPGNLDLHHLNAHPALLRTPGSEPAWRRVQTELLDAAADVYDVRHRLKDWQAVKLPQPVQVLLTALVIVADWIASNPELFPYFPEETRTGTERVEAAWSKLELPRPWRAVEPEGAADELFGARFRLPPGARVRPVQEAAVRMARGMPGAGLMVIEAPMGEGKTEAALAVAEIFAARSGAGGCFVALPTMATGNAMFPRMLDWLRALPDARPVAAAGTDAYAVHLAHSKAALNEEYGDLVRVGMQGHGSGVTDVARDAGDERAAPAELVAHQWLTGRKKGMLAPFVVGTIDQLLFAGLKSRHLALRHLAVAGKTVIIDEAHAYDAYMNSYLDRVLSWLGAYGVPVVVLSATLPAGRRRELAEAYAGARSAPYGAAFAELEAAAGYPLLSAVAPGSAPQVAMPEASGRGTDVTVGPLADDPEALADVLAEALADGGCALVIRNTVSRVLETAALLRARFGAERVTVAHARFLDLDRSENDKELLAHFGPSGEPTATTPARRNSGHIVVASQVAEQSLDIDFDLLVSDLCPADLLLQRMGRLHRHQRGAGQSERPARLRSARCHLTGVDWTATPPAPVAGSVRVYGEFPLLRSLAVLEPHLTGKAPTGSTVRLPEHISDLVQRAYGPGPVGPDSWQPALAKAAAKHATQQAKQREKAATFLLNEAGRDGRPLIGWVEAGVGDADDTRAGRAQVRDSQESLEVVVLQRRRQDSVLTTASWLSPDRDGKPRGGLELPTDTAPAPRLGRIAAASRLRLPYHFSFPKEMDQAIDELERNYVPAWQHKDSHWLAGELVLVLDEDCQTSLAGFDLSYHPADGLEVQRAQ